MKHLGGALKNETNINKKTLKYSEEKYR